jgi:hypothetical protein
MEDERTDTGESCIITMTTIITQMIADEEGCSLLSLVRLEKRRLLIALRWLHRLHAIAVV